MKRFQFPLKFPLSLLLCVLSSGVITLVVLWTHPVSFSGMLRQMLRQPLILLLNWLPILLLVLAFFFLLRNVFFSSALVGFFTAALGIANRVKMQVRDEPLVPRDFGLLKEAADAAGSYNLQLPWLAIALVVALAVFCVLLGLLLPSPFGTTRARSLRPRNPWGLRLGGFGGCTALVVVCILFLYSSTPLYSSFKVSNPYNLTVVCNELGLPYFFSYHFSTYRLDKPADFSKSVAASWESGEQTDKGAAVNVVFVMNEAFSDLTNADLFTYDRESDPLKNFNALRGSENALSGHVVVPGFAGGTANTEFDIITGMQTNTLSSTSNSAFRSFNRNLDSIVRIFADDGYKTSFLHPGDRWFYNRENVYKWLGAQESLFVEDFENSRSKGRWVTDDTVAQNLLARFDQSMAVGETVFDYAVTIQNHMSYTADKYGADYVYPPVETDLPLSEATDTLLRVYIEGLRDADAMLKTLTDHYAASGEPVILVFFGDHLPYLGDNRSGYKELGLAAGDESGTSDPLASYQTPFLLWCNNEAAAQVDLSALDLPTDGILSASFLGAAVLELTGRGALSPWFAFLNELRRELPVLQNGLYRSIDGETLTELPVPLQEKLTQWQQWTYYKIKYKKVA